MKLPPLKSPVDSADRAVLVRVAVYSVLMLWAAAVLGAAVRVFLMAAGLT